MKKLTLTVCLVLVACLFASCSKPDNTKSTTTKAAETLEVTTTEITTTEATTTEAATTAVITEVTTTGVTTTEVTTTEATTTEVTTTEATTTAVTTEVTEITEEPATPKAILEALNKELEIIKNNEDGYLTLVDAEGNEISEANIAIYKAMLPRFTYEISSVTIVDDINAKVTATLTTVDFITVWLDYYMVAMEHQSEIHWDPGMEVLAEMLSAEDAPFVTTETIINMIKENGKWIISPDNEEFSNALLGGV